MSGVRTPRVSNQGHGRGSCRGRVEHENSGCTNPLLVRNNGADPKVILIACKHGNEERTTGSRELNVTWGL